MDTEIAQKIAKKMKIPPRPDVLMAVTHEAQSPQPDIAVIINAISKDVSLSSAVLQVVNSPFFGLIEKISSIDQAVNLLGYQRVEKVATTVAMRTSVSGKLELDKFWNNAIEVADVSRSIATHFKDVDPDDAYTLGLFHDCGMPLMMQKFVTYMRTYDESVAKEIRPLTALEDGRYKVNHTTVGAILCEQSFLPERITEAVLNHHAFYDSFNAEEHEDEDFMLLLAILKMSEHILSRFHIRDAHANEWDAIANDVLSYVGMTHEEYENMHLHLLEMLRDHH